MPKKIEFNWDKLEALCQYRPFLSDVSEYLGVSEDTVERYIKKRYGITFAEFRDKKMFRTRFNLTEKALQMALSGNVTMMIFCLKNLCGWADKTEIKTNTEKEDDFKNYTNEELAKIAKGSYGQKGSKTG